MEMNKNTPSELNMLEFLAEQSRCSYLSDLKFLPQARMLWILEGLSPSAFSLKAWLSTAEYLTGLPQNFSSEADAKAFLLAFYSKAPTK